MYIKRACLNELGYFDADFFPRAYGEEADLCYRASYVGWKHVIAPNVFVSHFHGKSFGEEKEGLMKVMLDTFRELHPQFYVLDASFWRADPVKPARRSLDLARLAGFIALNKNDLTICESEGDFNSSHPFLIFDHASNKIKFNDGVKLASFLDLPEFLLPHDIHLLVDALRLIGVQRVVYLDSRCKEHLEASTLGESYETDWAASMSCFNPSLLTEI